MIVVDFDGTVIRGDLTCDFSLWYQSNYKRSFWQKLVGLPIGALNYVSRKLFETPAGNRHFLFTSIDELKTAGHEFIQDRADFYDVNWGLIQTLQSRSSKCVLLSGGLEFLIRDFLSERRIHAFDEVVGQRSGKLHWVLNPCPYGRAKPKFVTAPIEIAIGNDYPDRHILRVAQRGIVVRADEFSDHPWMNEFQSIMFGDKFEPSQVK